MTSNPPRGEKLPMIYWRDIKPGAEVELKKGTLGEEYYIADGIPVHWNLEEEDIAEQELDRMTNRPQPVRGAPIRQVDLILSQQINKAISDEIEAIRMYGRIGDMATDPLHADARAVFKNIAKEEMRHKEVLEDLAAALRQRLGT